jgi:site-specific DNA-adenine methylase
VDKMSLTKLEGDLLRVREDLGKAKQANVNFEKVLQEMSILKSRSMANPETKEQIMSELKQKEIINLFTSIQDDFEELRQRMTKQSIEKEQILDFIESVRTKKSFGFEETESTFNFLESSVDILDADIISVRPEFIGMIDLGPMAINMQLTKNNSGVIVEKERFSEVLAALVANKMFHDLIFETDKAKIVLKTLREITVEADNSVIRDLSRIAKPQY